MHIWLNTVSKELVVIDSASIEAVTVTPHEIHELPKNISYPIYDLLVNLKSGRVIKCLISEDEQAIFVKTLKNFSKSEIHRG